MQYVAASNRHFPIWYLLVTMWLVCALSIPSTSISASIEMVTPEIYNINVPFVANEGEVDSRVSFYARTLAGTLFVTTEGQLVYSLPAGRKPLQSRNADGTQALTGWTLTESFTATPTAPVGLRPAVTKVSNFVVPAGKTQSDLPTYEGVGLGEVAPGISLELRAFGYNVEKLFRVAPGADTKRIRIKFVGAEHLSLADNGSLVVTTGIGQIEFTAPVAYQEHDGKRIAVPAVYVLATADEYGFSVGAHDPTLPLTIDPLIRSTYAGGTLADVVLAMLVHPGSGDVYVAGSTTSANFPGTSTGGQTGNLGGTDAFVAHFNSSLTTLLRASYYGGSNVDIANAIAILPRSGDIYIAGTTTSPDLPRVSGTFGGGSDGFIARFDGALDTLIGARYYGGTGNDAVSGLAVDNLAGDIFVVGDTTSVDLALGAGPQQGSSGGGQDAFVARFSADLTTLIRGTYFGGSGADRALAVAFDPFVGDIILGGVTSSVDLPGTANGALPTNGGLNDGFVARYSGDLTTLRQSSYFGGSGMDQINALAIHPLSGQIYVGGDTRSVDLRGKPSGQLANSSGSDAFVARFNRDLTGLQAVSYFGGFGDEFGNALAISNFSGEIYLAGYSTSGSLPGTVSGMQEANAGGNEAYVARFDAGLVGVKQTTFLGGSGSDIAHALALTDSVAYVAGETASSTFPGTLGSSQPNIVGVPNSDGFISALGSDLRFGNSNPAIFSFAAIANAIPLSVQISAPAKVTPTGDAIAYVDGQPGSAWCASTNANCSCDRTGNTFTNGSMTLTTTAPNSYYVCVRNTASAALNAIVESTLHIGASAATFRVATSGVPGFGCTLDVDGNGAQDALTDGLLVLRALFGLTGTAATNGAIAANAVRATWSDISLYFNANCGASFSP